METRNEQTDVDLVAAHLARTIEDMEQRFEGVRADFELAMLQEHTRVVRRFERLEALVAEKFGDDIAASLTALLDT